MIEKLRKEAADKQKIINFSSDYSEKDKKIISIINDLLTDDACFLKIDIYLAMQILFYLGYTKQEAQITYISLVQESSKVLKGKYTLMEPDNLFDKNK